MNALTQCASLQRPLPVISPAGTHALLVDAKGADFDLEVQRLVWSLAKTLVGFDTLGITELVPGVNNLLVIYDPERIHPAHLRELLTEQWLAVDVGVFQGREVEIPVTYGGAAGEDLQWLAETIGLEPEQWIARHSEAVYHVACIGSMPGFAYLTGLPLALAQPRRNTPRTRLEKGAVIIGGAQAGVMPCTAPSGWHVVGTTTVELFDPNRLRPCLLAPGDTVRFIEWRARA